MEPDKILHLLIYNNPHEIDGTCTKTLLKFLHSQEFTLVMGSKLFSFFFLGYTSSKLSHVHRW